MNPFAATLNPANHTLYVLAEEFATVFSQSCARYSNGIDTFDTASLTNTKNADWYPGGDYRAGIGVNPMTGYIYVASGGASGIVEVRNGGISVFPLQTVSVGAGPAGIAIDMAVNKIYVANSGSNDVSVIDGASSSVLATITDPNATAPVAVAVNPTTNTIYVANSQSNNVTVIDGATGSVTATVAVGTSPSGLDVDSQTNFIYVANAGTSQPSDPGNITVINGATHATYTLTDQNAKNPVAVAVNPTTNKIYVANSGSNNVTVIDGAHE
jgi:YVTN family beta-propeller protein